MLLADWLEMKSFSTNLRENKVTSHWCVTTSIIFEAFFWRVRYSGLNADMLYKVVSTYTRRGQTKSCTVIPSPFQTDNHRNAH